MNKEEFSDDMLIVAYINGEALCFNVLYDRYKRQIYSYLNRLLPNQRSLCDDIFQQTWIRIIHQLPKYKNKQRFLAWAMRIAHNLTIDHFRKGKREFSVESIETTRDKLFDENSEPWAEIDRGSLGNALEWALAKLAPELKEVFLLRQDNLSFKEIADIQNCSVNTALGRMQYALKNLQKFLADWHRGVRL